MSGFDRGKGLRTEEDMVMAALDLTRYRGGLDWVIVGGESGRRTRPMDLAWARSIVAQCKAALVPCFVKQLGFRPTGFPGRIEDPKGANPAEWPGDLRIREWPR